MKKANGMDAAAMSGKRDSGALATVSLKSNPKVVCEFSQFLRLAQIKKGPEARSQGKSTDGGPKPFPQSRREDPRPVGGWPAPRSHRG